LFAQVQEAAAASEGFLQMPDAFVNMGTLYLALNKPQSAIQVCWVDACISLLCLSMLPPNGGAMAKFVATV
jgi:hypothetical protein